MVISGLFLFVIFLLVWRIHTALTTYHITAKFKEMKPLPHHIQVLYKGLKIGNVISVKHSDDLEYTLIKLRLPKKIKLPHNVIAHLMIEKRRFHDYDYIELVKPESTSEECLTSNSEIQGIAMVDSRNFFANQNIEDLETARDNLFKASESLNNTIEGLGELFVLLQDVVKENQANLNQVTKNLSHTTGNLNNATQKIDNAIVEKQLRNSFDYLENSLSNFNTTSGEINNTAMLLNEEFPVVINDSKKILNNLEEITSAVSSSMQKPFGGFRLLFGRTIDNCR